MRIDFSNCNIINSPEIYVHDHLFKELRLDYDKKELVVIVGKPEFLGGKKEFIIRFCNVLGFDMTMCDFWSPSIRLMDWVNIEKGKQQLIPKLYAEKQDNDYQFSRLADDIDYIESVLLFISGDRLSIACEYIIFDDLL